jgi:succinoglycan biosynthesis protein ExoA
MADSLPTVTVIMPVFNEAATIASALAAALAQDYPPDRLDVLIVDGGSSDGTLDVVRALAGDHPRVRLLHNPARQQAHGLNLGIADARGAVIVRVDGHTLVAPDYVRRCVQHLEATGAEHVGGPQRAAGHTPLVRAIAAAYRSPFGVPSRFTTAARAGFTDTVYLGAWPRAVFAQVGGFNTDLAANEDYEHSYRIRQAGGRVYLAPDIRSEYVPRQTLNGLARQFFRYGRGKCQMLTLHPRSARPRHLAAPAFLAALAGGALVAPFSRAVARLWGALLAAYGLASAVASLDAARRGGWDHLPRLPVIFAAMHLAWGAGFWIELGRQLVAERRRR